MTKSFSSLYPNMWFARVFWMALTSTSRPKSLVYVHIPEHTRSNSGGFSQAFLMS